MRSVSCVWASREKPRSSSKRADSRRPAGVAGGVALCSTGTAWPVPADSAPLGGASSLGVRERFILKRLERIQPTRVNQRRQTGRFPASHKLVWRTQTTIVRAKNAKGVARTSVCVARGLLKVRVGSQTEVCATSGSCRQGFNPRSVLFHQRQKGFARYHRLDVHVVVSVDDSTGNGRPEGLFITDEP